MTDCPRRYCRGAVGVTWQLNCTQCARGSTPARPPSAFQMYSRGSGVVTDTNYLRGIYAIGYVPTRDDITRAKDWGWL